MLDVTTAGWALTVGFVLVLLAIDLTLAITRPHEVGFREAVVWSIFYIAVAVAFGLVFASIAGWGFGGEYFAGYIVEKSLSVDNLFVFVVIMTTFAVPAEHQQKVLIVGIVLALVLRVIFIALGAALLAAFSFMFLLFGLLLVGTAIQLFRHRDQDPTVDDNALVTFARKRLPLTDDYHGGKLLTRIDGRRMFTPLFLVLIAIGCNRPPLRAGLDPGRLRRHRRDLHRASRPTPLRCSACAPCTSLSPACSTGSSTSPPASRSSSPSSASSSSCTGATSKTIASPRSPPPPRSP